MRKMQTAEACLIVTPCVCTLLGRPTASDLNGTHSVKRRHCSAFTHNAGFVLRHGETLWKIFARESEREREEWQSKCLFHTGLGWVGGRGEGVFAAFVLRYGVGMMCVGGILLLSHARLRILCVCGVRF